MDKRLYVVMHPIEALIGSQLQPAEFASHYKFGSFKHYEGKLIFAEIDAGFRNKYFEIERAMEGVVEHDDGRPKATKYIKNYRVLEHIDLPAYKQLYLVNSDSSILGLEQTLHDDVRHENNLIRLYIEIAPLRFLLLSNLNYKDFGSTMVKDSMKGAPVVCFSQIEFDAEDFLENIKNTPFITSPIPGVHPEKLRKAIEEMKRSPSKKTKGLSLATYFDALSYKNIRHGIILSNGTDIIEYKIPSISEIEEKNFKFWKAM